MQALKVLFEQLKQTEISFPNLLFVLYKFI